MNLKELYELAHKIYREDGNNEESAERLFAEAAVRGWTVTLARYGAALLLATVMRERRQRINHRASFTGTVNQEDSWADDMLVAADFPLKNDVKVRNATADQLQEGIEYRRRLARGNLLAAEFLSLVLAARERAGVPADAETCSGLSVAEIQVIHDSVYHGEHKEVGA
jgi:hypothetical protein